MAVGCGAKCAKFMLIFFNIIFWLSGCAILGIGIWMTVDSSVLDQIEVLNVDTDDPMLEYAAYILIAMGCFVFIVGFLGCCGAIKESKCMLGMYIFFLLLIMAGELAAGILALVYKDKILDTATDALVTKLQNDTIYSKETDGKYEFTAFGLTISAAQVDLKCCGINGTDNYASSAFEKRWSQPFPATCCVMKEDTKFSEDLDIADSVVDMQKCMQKEDGFVNSDGCRDGLEKLFSEKALILIGIGIGIACLEIFGFIFAICLCRNTGEDLE